MTRKDGAFFMAIAYVLFVRTEPLWLDRALLAAGLVMLVIELLRKE